VDSEPVWTLKLFNYGNLQLVIQDFWTLSITYYYIKNTIL